MASTPPVEKALYVLPFNEASAVTPANIAASTSDNVVRRALLIENVRWFCHFRGIIIAIPADKLPP